MSSRELPVIGVVKYNGFTFPTAIQSRLQCVQVPGSAGNTTKYNLYTFTIECVVVSEDEFLDPETDEEVTPDAGEPVDDNLENIRRRVSAAGAAFEFTSQGLGDDMIVNDIDNPESKWDSAFGPKPRLIAWEPMGSNRAVRVIWLCEIALTECEDFNLSTFGPQASNSALPAIDYSYDMTFDIEDGITTRTIRGTLEIATTSLEDLGNTPFSIADTQWDLVYARFPQLEGFRRKTSRTISRDGRTLEFVIVDRELPSEFPLLAGAVEIDADFGVNSNLVPNGFYTWNAEFSGRIKLAPQIPRWQAWNMFLILFNSRYRRAFGYAKVKGRQGNYYTQVRRPFPMEVSLNESIYSREYSFSVTWIFFAFLEDLFRFSGIFGDFTSVVSPSNPNWTAWEQSMAAYGPKSARGWANMGMVKQDVRRNDPCTIQRMGLPYTNNIAAKQTITTFYPLYNEVPPSQEQSYLYGKFRLDYEQGKNSTSTTPNIQIDPSEITPAPGSNTSAGVGTRLDQTQANNGTASLIQVRGPSRNRATLSGVLSRVNYPVQIPKIVSIGGKPVYQADLRVSTDVIPGSSYPIFVTAFEIDYDLDGPATGDIVLDTQTDADVERYV